jgi:hypothetical protein
VVVTAMPVRAIGRQTVAVPIQGHTRAGLMDRVDRIRVIGREDRTAAENARYKFLESSLTRSHRRRVPFFVNSIWFPKNLKGQNGRSDARTDSSFGKASQPFERLNNSQREVATAMLSVSTCDYLVIVHGILYDFYNVQLL